MKKTLERIFIKNWLSVDVDGLRGINRYKIYAMFDEEQLNGRYELKNILIEDLEMTWSEIESEGGISEINKQLKECWNV